MSYIEHLSKYDKFPTTHVTGYEHAAVKGYTTIAENIKKKAHGSTTIIVVDCYPGVDDEEVLPSLMSELQPDYIMKSEDIFYDEEKLNDLMKTHLTKDRVRGFMYYGTMMDFINTDTLVAYQNKLKEYTGVILLYGVGASLISYGDILVYADMARWEIQLRYRKGMPNFRCTNYDEDSLVKNKRGYFIEWRIADKHKRDLYEKIDFYLDTNKHLNPKMVHGDAFRAGLKQIAQQPFRLVPYFDQGVWGGQWMKDVCNLDREVENYAWSFDGVPEENSIYLGYGDITIESPAMNLVLYSPKELLGAKNYARFGAEFPIRFDFLDTMDGQNLSLQVHPLTDYIKTKFGMPYTQDESYYVLDCKGDGGVYLGLKEGIDKEEMMNELRIANKGEKSFPAEKYVNLFKAKKHDHYLIPAGTIHCSTKNTMILEVSATPYIFTFKLWDWDRLGLDGIPRPIHIDDGERVIQWDRTTPWVKEHLVNCFTTLHDDKDYTEVKTGLHELEFIETRVFTSNHKTMHKTCDGVHVLNLVDGKSVVIESPTNKFEPYTIHYAETFIIPASVDAYTIRPENIDQEYKVLKAFVRNDM